MKASNQVEPLFVRHNTKVSSKKTISHCCIQNGVVLLGLQSQTLQHIRIQTGKFTDIPLSLAGDDKIAHIHLDYRGCHALVSTELGENFYMNMKTVALKPLKRLKGHVISAVGFNFEKASDQETGFVVLGTNKGQLLETNVTSAGAINYLKVLSQSLVENAPISAVRITPYSLDNDLCWLLIVCTPGRLYCIPGVLNVDAMDVVPSQPVVGTVWSSVLVEQQSAVMQNFFSSKANPRYHSLGEQKSEKPSDVVVFPMAGDLMPEKYCWLASEGISAGHFETNKDEGFDIINEDWFRKHGMSEGKYNYPLNVALSEYHVFLVFTDRFQAISLLDQKLAFEDVFNDNSHVLGMCRDSTSQFIWVFTETGLFYYRPDRETRDVWKVLVDRNEFSKARKIAKQMSDKRPYQVVLKKEADKYLADQNYVAAAELLAESTEPFESTVLKFLKSQNSRDSRNGLKRYLELKLDSLDRRDKVKRDILVIWLLEVQLSELSELKRVVQNGDKDRAESGLLNRESQSKKLREELYCFLNRTVVNECVLENRAAVYRMITAHVDFDTYLFLANKLKDLDVVVNVHLLQSNFQAALDVAISQPELVSKYAQDFFDHIPKHFIKALLTAGQSIKPTQVLTAFFKCSTSPEHIAASFAYLSHIVEQGRADRTVHDYYIKLLAEYKPTKLLDHLKKYGQTIENAAFDVDRALRLCLEKKLNDCSVFLYGLEGLHENAVDLALSVSRWSDGRRLQIDVSLAKECAKQLDLDENSHLADLSEFGFSDFGSSVPKEVKKRVWLAIAKHVIQSGADVSESTSLLKESNHVLGIEDILPFFPDFTKIDQFKQPLCDCLRDHSKRMQDLQSQISSVTESTAQIREQIEKCKTNTLVIKSGDKCAVCHQNLLQQPFFAFNCRHFFHQTCLVQHLTDTFSEGEARAYNKMKEHERSLKAEVLIKSGKDRTEAAATLDKIIAKIQEFISRECPYCSWRVVRLLRTPLISEEEYKKTAAEWLL